MLEVIYPYRHTWPVERSGLDTERQLITLPGTFQPHQIIGIP
jgi:hypothetical protein